MPHIAYSFCNHHTTIPQTGRILFFDWLIWYHNLTVQSNPNVCDIYDKSPPPLIFVILFNSRRQRRLALASSFYTETAIGTPQGHIWEINQPA